jgi:arsenite transporter
VGSDHAVHLIVPALAVMLLSVFLGVPLRSLTDALHHPRFTGLSFGINFVWTPVLAYGLGFVFLHDHSELWLGLIMLLVTPCTDWYLVFTSLARGDLRLSTALLPWNLVLQLLLLPVHLLLFGGTFVRIEYGVVLHPDRPLLALALVIGPLIELPVLAVTANGLLALRQR